ncbi:MAG: PrsW family intramembrane metalloprotease [Patescibacteria group bacterium]|nr:PrsW family intramembrane metalloprotease [Patescibacteria group bacterium]MDE1946084.1 PrsW family intramembrane metalloprotease [Patescibacteria group bacterium]
MHSEALSFVIAFLGGFLPSFVWLFFWNEEKKSAEPLRALILAFAGGMAAVFISLFLEKTVYNIDPNAISHGALWQAFLSWAKAVANMKNVALGQFLLVTLFAPIIEETLKFLAAYLLVLRSRDDEEPIDPVIFMITTALGFAAVENMLFLLDPLTQSSLHVSIYTGNMRFVGAMLLHTVSSATIGLFIGFNFFDTKIEEYFWGFTGLVAAILIHSLFNFFMIGSNSLVVLEGIWISVIMVLFIIEKVKRIRLEKIEK